jgi:hypothetical protein
MWCSYGGRVIEALERASGHRAAIVSLLLAWLAFMAAVAIAGGEGHVVGHGGVRHSTRDRKRRYRKGDKSNENGSDEDHD